MKRNEQKVENTWKTEDIFKDAISIYLENIEDFGVVNVLFAEAFGDHKPARTTISVKGLPKNALIMVDAIALANDYH